MPREHKHQLIPPPELSPPSIKHLSFAEKYRIWAELVDESEALLIAGLKAKVGPDGDWQQAYREWYARRMEEHERTLYRIAEKLTRAADAQHADRTGAKDAIQDGADDE